MLHMLAGIGTAVFACIVNVFCYKQRKSGKKWKFSKEMLPSGKKEWGCFFLMLGATSVFSALLSIYHQNSFAQDFRRICLLCLLWPIAWNDYKEEKIPNIYLKAGCVYWVMWIIISCLSDRQGLLMEIVRSIFAVLMAAAVCAVCLFVMKNCMGMGDVKLLMVMGLLQGTTGFVSSVVTSLFVSFFVCIYYLASRKKGRKDSIALAPSVLAGATISILLKGV